MSKLIKNAQPEASTAAEFLETYQASVFPSPLLSVDPVLFTYYQEQLQVLLVLRSNHPDQGLWGLPGGFVDQQDTTLEATALRKLREKTAVQPPYLEQLYTFGDALRDDQRGWSVTVAYTALIAYQQCQATIETVRDAQWWPYEQLRDLKLAFDHAAIIDFARERLRQKALYSIVPAYALPALFTLPELQHVHEVLLGRSIQTKSFRRRIEQAALLEDSGQKRSYSGGRPASLYRMKNCARSYTFVRNLED